jgi:hypothetical protein
MHLVVSCKFLMLREIPMEILGNAFSGQWCYCISLVYGWAMHLVVSGVIVFHLYMVGQ